MFGYFQNSSAQAITKFSCFLLLCLLISSPNYAQQNGGTTQAPARKKAAQPKKPKEPSLSLQQRQAIEFLDIIGNKAELLSNSPLKIKTLAKVADSLWAYNESRARQLFLTAFQAIDSISSANTNNPWQAFELRSLVLQLLARHDYKLATDLQNKLSNADPPDAKDKKALQQKKSQAAQLTLNLAVALAKTQPERASQLVRAQLAQGVNRMVIVALFRMRRENQALADQLFQQALTVARTTITSHENIEALVIFVLPSEEDIFFGNKTTDPAKIAITQQFLDYVCDALTAQLGPENTVSGGESGLDSEDAAHEYRQLRDLMPLFESFRPTQTAFVQSKMAALLGLMSAEQANVFQPQKPALSIDDMLHEAEATVGDRKRNIRFIRVSGAALKAGNIEQAIDIAGRISNLEDRKSQKSIILYQASMQKIRNGDWDAAYRLAQRIDFPPQRAFIFQTLAQKFYSNKEIDRAQATLEEIWSWVEKIDSLPQKTQAMFELSAAMTLINPPRSFEISETAIKTLNSTDFSAPVPKDNDRILVDSEITAEIVQIEPLFTSLARFDFARAIQLTQLITNNEISLFAQSVACQKILRPNA